MHHLEWSKPVTDNIHDSRMIATGAGKLTRPVQNIHCQHFKPILPQRRK